MGKSSIELTLKQLIDLGIIKLKKKKRRRKQKRVKQYISDNIKSDSSGMVGYSQTMTPPNYLNQNTDALRLRDAQADINTKQLEQKYLLEDAKNNSNEFQDKTKQAFQYVFNSITNPAIRGYAEDDNFGAFGATQGSDGFISQRDDEPNTIIRDGPSIEDIDDEEDPLETTSLIQSTTTPQRLPAPISSSKSAPAPVSRFFGALGIKSPFNNTKLAPASMLDNLADPSTYSSVPHFADGDETDVFGHNERFQETLSPPTIRNRQGFRLAEVMIPEDQREPLKVAGGGGAKYSEEKPVPEKSAIGRASNAELDKWRKAYQDLAGEDAKQEILEAKKRTDIEAEMARILIRKYTALGGKKKEVLKSKNVNQISSEITQLKQKLALDELNNILS